MKRRVADGEMTVQIPVNKVTLNGNLTIPPNAKGIVLFAHGSGSSRFSPRNTRVAKEINQAGIATLLIDLLTAEEEKIDESTGEFRFNIGLLAERVVDTTKWLKKNPATQPLAVGYFEASTGAAAALIAAVKLPEPFKAVVSRGGRPDLAAESLPQVKVPMLLIMGGEARVVLEMNREAMKRMVSEKQLELVRGATSSV